MSLAAEVPVVKATVSLEKGPQKKTVLKGSMLSLKRNEFKGLVLRVDPGIKGGGRSYDFTLKQDEVVLHRNFIKEGKMSIHLKKSDVRILVSNAPPHQLVMFIKSMASKLAGESGKVGLKNRLLSEVSKTTEEISPVTLKDVENLKRVEKNKTGILKLKNSPSSSPLSSKTGIKRTRLSSKLEKSPPKPAPTTPKGIVKMTSLTSEQNEVLRIIKSGRNVFFTGGAGTGKSFLIKRIIGILPPDATFVTASTGVAAFQIGGVTLHSFAGMGSGVAPIDKCIQLASRKNVAPQWRRCSHLIIDEISMLDGRFFEKLEEVARVVRCSDKPFGGIQLILTGDFLQLPPVTKRSEERVFCFESSAWSKCIRNTVELTSIKRQTDAHFIEILKQVRLGRTSEEMTKVLKATSGNKIEKNGVLATKLCTHKEDVVHINKTELAKLSGSPRVFIAMDSVPDPSCYTNVPVDDRIELKVGSQVMLMKNLNVTAGLVNGARGCVTGFSPQSGFPIVRFIGCPETEIKNEKWVVRTSGGLLVTRNQLPLKLAWAFSIHKSQGMTLDCVEVSLSRVFEVGQAYVALSRAKDLASLRILDFNPGCIRADPKVLRFYRNLELMTPTDPTSIRFHGD